MKLKMFQVDAFTRQVLSGNPAAVCPLDDWLPDAQMQALALENNLSETAFFVKKSEGRYDLRWFTPTVEVDLCGHATLASAYTIWNHLGETSPKLGFETRSGLLEVTADDGRIALNFPLIPSQSCPLTPLELAEGLGVAPTEVLGAGPEGAPSSYLAIYESEQQIRDLEPDFGVLMKLGKVCVNVTAPARDVDFVSRFFAPAFGIDEDPATGSAHCALTPYWSRRLGKSILLARQVSARGGEIFCELLTDRVVVAGYAVLYMEATIHV
jgi:PhzF family phenazine biosynthesis protein